MPPFRLFHFPLFPFWEPDLISLTGSSIISAHGLPIVVDLPGVGENFQEQPNIALVYNSTKPDTVPAGAISPYAAFLSAGDLFGPEQLADVASRTLASLPAWSAQIAAANGNRVSAQALERILRLQHDLIFAKNVTVAEIICFARPGEFGSALWPLLPFSRGSVHLNSKGAEGRNPVSQHLVDFAVFRSYLLLPLLHPFVPSALCFHPNHPNELCPFLRGARQPRTNVVTWSSGY